MTKYEKLEKLQNLKESGAITQEEFEVEKQKVLNAKENITKKKRKLPTSKIFFILTAVFVIITLGLFKYHNSYCEKYDNFLMNELSDLNFDHSIGKITDSEYKQTMDYWNEIGDNSSRIGTLSYISLGITIILYMIGVIIQIKNNKKMKNRILIGVITVIILIAVWAFVPMIKYNI